ncbi:hypothetical protein Dda_8066 [Drechslerella dactyloides]|uniref:HhH-GPD domain-containing protein n=1 Tax=Drechslerella dactyloides TaxID=74499 RepID=A0AAD6IRE5_DREDA|nr:hypothetical protein Dda_8066 [Drechslerella dactyloides]
MVARNPRPAVQVRASARISMRLKASKAAPAPEKTTASKSRSTKTKAAKEPVTTAVATVRSRSKVVKAKAPAKRRGTAKSKSETPEDESTAEQSEIATTETTETVTISTAVPTDVHPGVAHLLAINPNLASVISRHACDAFPSPSLSPAEKDPIDPFQALCSGIIAQQVSNAAARSIKARFIALFNDNDTFPAPADILNVDLPTLRTAGLSQRKAEYISGLAEQFRSGELTNDMLLADSDEAVTEKLLKVRGLGLWSVQMFLLFALKRTDVFATGDLGIQRGMAILAGRDVSKLKKAAKDSTAGKKWKYMTEDEMLRLSEQYRPYRSVLSWYLWRLADTDVEVMRKK